MEFSRIRTKRLCNIHGKDANTLTILAIRNNIVKTFKVSYQVYSLYRLVINYSMISKIISVNWKNLITLVYAQDTWYSRLAAVLSGNILNTPIISSHDIQFNEAYSSFKNSCSS